MRLINGVFGRLSSVPTQIKEDFASSGIHGPQSTHIRGEEIFKLESSQY